MRYIQFVELMPKRKIFLRMFLKKYNMNHIPSQHGFVLKKSCVTNLLECQNEVSGFLRDNESVDVLYTDFEKAFDKVSTSIA